MAQRPPVRKLLVEGDDDKRVIPELIEANGIPWVDSRGDWIVSIEPMNGFEPILAAGEIETQLKASGLEALGIIVDANDDAAKRWTRVRARCIAHFPELQYTTTGEPLRSFWLPLVKVWFVARV